MREIQHLLKINVEFEVADGFEPAIQFPVKKKINLNHGSTDLADELTATQTINKKTRRIKLIIVTETKWVRKKDWQANTSSVKSIVFRGRWSPGKAKTVGP